MLVVLYGEHKSASCRVSLFHKLVDAIKRANKVV